MKQTQPDFSVIGALPYETVRDDCHAIKWEDKESIGRCAIRLAASLPPRAVLVPVPSHTGTATYTRTLSQAIRSEALRSGKQCFVLDICTCRPHESLHTLKHEGKSISDVHLTIRLRYRETDSKTLDRYKEEGFRTVIVDNVIDSGMTARACLGLLGSADILTVGDTGNWKTQQETA